MGPSRYGHPEIVAPGRWPTGAQNILTGGRSLLRGSGRKHIRKAAQYCVRSKFYGQAERAISNGKLNVLPRLHIRPIKQVVFLCPS